MSVASFQMILPLYDSSEIFFPRYDSSVTFVKSMFIWAPHIAPRHEISNVLPSSYFPENTFTFESWFFWTYGDFTLADIMLLADKVSAYVHSEKRVPSVLLGFQLTLLPDKVIVS